MKHPVEQLPEGIRARRRSIFGNGQARLHGERLLPGKFHGCQLLLLRISALTTSVNRMCSANRFSPTSRRLCSS